MAPSSSRAAAATFLLALLAACGTKSAPPPPPPVVCVANSTVTADQPWQLFGPTDWKQACSLTVQLPAVAADERLAVLLVNSGGDDKSQATVSVVGTGAPSLAPVTPPLASLTAGGDAGSTGLADQVFDDSGARRGEALVNALREETLTRTLDGRIKRVIRATPPGGPLAAAAVAPIPATRSFCVGKYGANVTTAHPDGFQRFWLGATLAFESPHAAFFYADEVKAGVDAAVAERTGKSPAGVAPFWGELAAAYENVILPSLTTHFGLESDVDGNGKMIFLFANNGKIGTPPTASFVAGYFWSADLVSTLANPTTCAADIVGAVGNRADMLYLMDPGNYTTLTGGTGANYPAALQGLVTSNYPSLMAHELQHNVNYNTRFPPLGPSGVREETWLNEGLSMLSETVAGYGLHFPSGRSAVRFYLGEAIPSTALVNPGVLYHRAYSLTTWEGDPYGNYGAVQAYMQYLLDHASPAMTKALENPALAGKANVAAATGVGWETGFARFVTASMFSNEDTSANSVGGSISSAGNLLASSNYNYIGDGVSPDYVPWHKYVGYCTNALGDRVPKDRLAHVAFTPLSAGVGSITPLRTDGWAAFATGPGSGGAATITVQSSASVRPQVVVVRYTGLLPNFTPLDQACP